MASTSTSSNCDKWYFTKEQLENTPSRKCGFDAYKELQYRQQAANFIQDMGQRLQVSQLCINTAIVYMHRFYVFHSFTNFPWHQMAAAALFLAAKVEEQPRKLEYVIRVANICKNPRDRNFDINSERYAAQSQDLVFNENVLLQTLGFDVAIDHPHTYVVRCCHLVRASKDLAQTSYFMASNSLHLTTMCVQYKPTVVACFCILLACKWANWEIPLSNEKKEWYTYVDPTVTAELLQQLTSEFLVIFENCPSRLKEKIAAKQESSSGSYEQEKRDSNSSRSLEYKGEDHHKNRSSRPPEAASSSHRSQEQREREYKERKEKERIAHMSGITLTNQSHHHRPPGDLNKLKSHSRPQSSGVAPYPPPGANRSELKDLLKEVREAPFVSLASREPNRGDLVKDNNYGAARGEKEVAKRDSFAKSNIQTDLNSLTNYSDARQQRVDPNRAKTADHSKTAVKQEMMTRRYEEQKISHIKTETDNIKKHLSSSSDKSNSNAYHKSTLISTSHKLKSPFNLDSKSVPKMMNQQPNAITQKSQFNGNNASGSYDKPPVFHETDAKIKTEIHPVKNEIPIPVVIKRPSLFSPDQTPQPVVKSEPLDKIPHSNLTVLSPISSPPLKNSKYSNSYDSKKKIDQVEGFENLMRENTIGMAAHVHNNDSKSTIVVKDEKIDIKNECHKESGSQSSLINGLDTNVNLISSLLKEAVSTSHLSSVVPTIKQETVETNTLVVLPASNTEKEHRHHKSKKKKEKHKHKDKSKEDKEKKRKHKEKDRDKHKNKEKRDTESDLVSQPISEPIKIKIQKDKIQPLNELKIKIPKDKIKTEGIVDSMVMPQKSSGGLKIKIPKDIIANCNPGGSNMHQLDMSATGMNHSRKRDRSSSSDAPTPCKISKMSHRESKQNGRHSFSKVTHGENETSILRLAESKFSKGSS
ncbi:hypothetical protein ABEB36_008449 [Hypothenemus hampei]|uniref:Cyclin-like domain-containing protein n=2 Tax=Hypothenemus hampei TaxID=57062 RepID=A0ABD1EQY3_HYPHA